MSVSRELALCVGLWNEEGRPVVFTATHPVGAVSGNMSALSPTLSPEIIWDHPISHLHPHSPQLETMHSLLTCSRVPTHLLPRPHAPILSGIPHPSHSHEPLPPLFPPSSERTYSSTRQTLDCGSEGSLSKDGLPHLTTAASAVGPSLSHSPGLQGMGWMGKASWESGVTGSGW